jgi:signal-transduction protein with cAMP-binding, CBS, and nucleotidyltransferase domain
MTATGLQPYHGSYLMPSLDHATVADAMHPGILSCDPDASLTEVARTMATHHVHSVAVIGVSHEDPECGVWAVVSDLDLAKAGIRGGADKTARSIATRPLISVEPGMSLRAAAELMLEHCVSHVVVVEPGSQRPVGVLSTLDLAGVLAWGEA